MKGHIPSVAVGVLLGRGLPLVVIMGTWNFSALLGRYWGFIITAAVLTFGCVAVCLCRTEQSFGRMSGAVERVSAVLYSCRSAAALSLCMSPQPLIKFAVGMLDCALVCWAILRRSPKNRGVVCCCAGVFALMTVTSFFGGREIPERISAVIQTLSGTSLIGLSVDIIAEAEHTLTRRGIIAGLILAFVLEAVI